MSTGQGQLESIMAGANTESGKVPSIKPILTSSSLEDMACEIVFVRSFRKVGKLHKIDEHYCGPYKILRILGVVCWLENLTSGRKIRVHADRIKICQNIRLDEAADINDGCIFTATKSSSYSTEHHRISEDTRKSMVALNDCVGFFKDNRSPVKQLAITVNSSAVPIKNPVKSNEDSIPVVKNMHFGLTCDFCKSRNHIALNCKLKIANEAVISFKGGGLCPTASSVRGNTTAKLQDMFCNRKKLSKSDVINATLVAEHFGLSSTINSVYFPRKFGYLQIVLGLFKVIGLMFAVRCSIAAMPSSSSKRSSRGDKQFSYITNTYDLTRASNLNYERVHSDHFSKSNYSYIGFSSIIQRYRTDSRETSLLLLGFNYGRPLLKVKEAICMIGIISYSKDLGHCFYYRLNDAETSAMVGYVTKYFLLVNRDLCKENIVIDTLSVISYFSLSVTDSKQSWPGSWYNFFGRVNLILTDKCVARYTVCEGIWVKIGGMAVRELILQYAVVCKSGHERNDHFISPLIQLASLLVPRGDCSGSAATLIAVKPGLRIYICSKSASLVHECMFGGFSFQSKVSFFIKGVYMITWSIYSLHSGGRIKLNMAEINFLQGSSGVIGYHGRKLITTNPTTTDDQLLSGLNPNGLEASCGLKAVKHI